MLEAVLNRPALWSVHKGHVELLIAQPLNHHRKRVGELEDFNPWLVSELLFGYLQPLVDIFTTDNALNVSGQEQPR